jgi:hypothetical protein
MRFRERHSDPERKNRAIPQLGWKLPQSRCGLWLAALLSPEDIRSDRSNLNQDAANLRTEQSDLRHDYAEQRAGVNDQRAINQARGQISTDRRDIGQDRSDIRQDAGTIRSDRQDLRADRSDLRQDSPGQSQERLASNDADRASDQRMKSHGGVEPPLSANTLANDTADNSKKTQTEQATHKPWYHWFF